VNDWPHLLERLSVEPRPYASLPWVDDLAPPVLDSAADTAALVFTVLDSRPFEVFAPLMILLQGYLLGAGVAEAVDNPVREDLEAYGEWTATVHEAEESQDFRSWQAARWCGWFEPSIEILRDVWPILAREGIQRSFVLVHEKRTLNWFLREPGRRRAFERLSLPIGDVQALHDACVQVLEDAVTQAMADPDDLRSKNPGACYLALQVLALHQSSEDPCVKRLRQTAHDRNAALRRLCYSALSPQRKQKKPGSGCNVGRSAGTK
jgi:hypothetical protein